MHPLAKVLLFCLLVVLGVIGFTYIINPCKGDATWTIPWLNFSSRCS
jgi:hypothetical protein